IKNHPVPSRNRIDAERLRGEGSSIPVAHYPIVIATDDDTPLAIQEWPKPLDPAAFHGLLGETVKTIAPHTEADPAALLFTHITLFGNVIGRNPHVRVGGSFHRANENTLLVGLTSIGRKGLAFDETLPCFDGIDPDWKANCHASGLSTA